MRRPLVPKSKILLVRFVPDDDDDDDDAEWICAVLYL
jgi:hypothetical protein